MPELLRTLKLAGGIVTLDALHCQKTTAHEILLTRGGWKSGSNAVWDKERALFPVQVFAFIEATQKRAVGRNEDTSRGRAGKSAAEYAGEGTGRERLVPCTASWF